MLSQENFGTWSKNYVLFAHITSYVAGEKYQGLLGAKGGRGFPYLAFLDANGAVLAKGFGRNVGAFTTAGEQAKATSAKLDELAKKAEGGDKAAQKQLFDKRMEMKGFDSYADAKAALDKLEVSEDEKKALGKKLIPMEVNEVMSTVRRNDKPTYVAAGKRFWAMAQAGRVPADQRTATNFWFFVMNYAEATKDVKAFETAYGKMKAALGGNPRAANFLKQWEAKLNAVKAAKGGN